MGKLCPGRYGLEVAVWMGLKEGVIRAIAAPIFHSLYEKL